LIILLARDFGRAANNVEQTVLRDNVTCQLLLTIGNDSATGLGLVQIDER
jgi:hypothetical protein